MQGGWLAHGAVAAVSLATVAASVAIHYERYWRSGGAPPGTGG
jgi:hypothetical protein